MTDRISTLTHHGMGRTESGALIPGTLPGELWTDGEITDPSPHRVIPPCSHAGSCGGCVVQHASDAFVARWKVTILRRALQGQGLDAPLRKAHISPARSRRRAKLSARRVKKGVLVGFHERASDQIIAIPECTVLTPAITAGLPALEALTDLIASRKGELDLTVTAGPSGLDVRIDGVPEVDLTDWATAHDIARVSFGDEPVLTRRPPAVPMGRAQVVPPPGAFLQATAQGQAALTAGVREALQGCKQIADLFAGSGTFALPLAEQADIVAVESVAPMLQALDAGWRKASGLHRIRTEVRDLFRAPLDAADLSPFDGVVLDPPRAGAEAQVRHLADGGPTRIAYVSCNPITFARDAKTLIDGGYDLCWIDLVDQFRWTSHVELVAQFTPT